MRIRLASCLCLALVALGSGRAAFAIRIEYSLDRAPELKACDEKLYRGETVDAQTCYADVMGRSNDTRIKADAARAAGDLRGANGYFQAAIKEYPQDAKVRRAGRH